ncbi:hypothetical protein [Lysinibacillus agricola]|uniref:hypothetical protein n=1 Tax=Lysinibacillus agricola TaxID=2590012 RepID=UPI003C2B1309
MILITVSFLLLIGFFLSENGWSLIGTYIFAVSSVGYFANELKKSRLGNIGNNKDVFDHDIISLRSILQKHNIHKIEQIDMLINQINEEMPRLKLSEKFLKSFYTISTVLLMPMLTLMIKWLLDYEDGGIYTVMLVVSLCLMVFGLFYIIKPLMEHMLDFNFRRMINLKRMLEDIKLIDFL